MGAVPGPCKGPERKTFKECAESCYISQLQNVSALFVGGVEIADAFDGMR